jgi:hypothetical protein
VTPASAERGVSTIERALANDGPLTRLELRERLERADVPTAGQALVHVLALASLRGLTVRGPLLGREQAYVLVRDWLGRSRPVERESALAELARRYLAGHGPADERDFAKWAGLPLRDVRAGLGAVAGELEERDGLLDLAGRPPAAELPTPRLLGAFEPVLLGWRSREPILGAHPGLVTVNGLFRPFALVAGRAVATWRLAGGRVTLEPLEPLGDETESALAAEAEAVLRYLEPGRRSFRAG